MPLVAHSERQSAHVGVLRVPIPPVPLVVPVSQPTPAVIKLSPAPLAQTGVVPILPINLWTKTGATTTAGGIEAPRSPSSVSAVPRL